MAMGPRKMGMRKMIGMKRAGAKMPKAMKAPKAMGPAVLEGQVPPMAGPMPQGMPGMKKGGAVKGKKMAKGGMAKAPKAGIGIMIVLGKKKGK